ncbi:MAG: SpoIIE family protein phosphatase [Anaerolineae bacterium]|nr:SpoIIE family protein phosphatase [Anaerolineae bacterium]
MEIQIGIAKVPKYDSIESGDTLEFVERPNGGVSVVMADAQTSGREAKALSSGVVRKAASLLAEGVRDSAAARAASDYLFTEKGGNYAAYLDIISVDLQSDTIVITRNNPTPALIARGECCIESLSGAGTPIGLSRNIRPSVTEIPLETDITVMVYTDGVQNAGRAYGQPIDARTLLESFLEDQHPSPQLIADTILLEAVRLDQSRPNDDMSIMVLRIVPHHTKPLRRMTVYIPFEQHFTGSD